MNEQSGAVVGMLRGQRRAVNSLGDRRTGDANQRKHKDGRYPSSKVSHRRKQSAAALAARTARQAATHACRCDGTTRSQSTCGARRRSQQSDCRHHTPAIAVAPPSVAAPIEMVTAPSAARTGTNGHRRPRELP